MRTSPLRAFVSDKNKLLKDLRPNDKNIDLDAGHDMPVKKSGLGPRTGFGGVKNPELMKNIVKHEQSKHTDFENPVTRNEIYKKTEKPRQ